MATRGTYALRETRGLCRRGDRPQASSHKVYRAGAATAVRGKDLTSASEKDGERSPADHPAANEAAGVKPRARRKRAQSPELGTALRSVYQSAVDEDIPPEMLDLLGKLG
jgi:hypothetical protein